MAINKTRHERFRRRYIVQLLVKMSNQPVYYCSLLAAYSFVFVCLVVCLFVHLFSHTCNIGHINYRLQFIYYNITYYMEIYSI